MPDNITKPVIFGAVYLILFTYEYYYPYFKNRQQHLKHSLNNLVLATINILVSLVFFVTALHHVCLWTEQTSMGLLNQITLSPLYAYLLAFLLIDFWQYVWHRLNHQIAFLWRFHQVHHADKDMDASTAVRFHPIEIIFSYSSRLIIIPLTGIQLEHLLLYELILLPVILFHHSNIKLPEVIDRYLRLVIVTPHIHRLHHSDIKDETDSNYASLFSFWDRLFNSYVMRDITSNFKLGLGDKFSFQEWRAITGMLKLPFKTTPG